MSPRTGRPHSENPKHVRVETRMTTEDFEKLEYCCKATGKSRSEIVREGIHEVYARLHNLEEN